MYLAYILYTIVPAILIAIGAIFSILAYSENKKVFYFTGLASTILALLVSINQLGFIVEMILYGDIIFIIVTIAWFVSIVFLILFMVNPKKKSHDNDIADAFLDEIIEGEDEDWDAES